MDPKHHTLEILFYIPQFQVQFLFCLQKLCEIRSSLFCEFCSSRFRRFFLVRHCYYSFLRATEPLENPKLQILILKKLTQCQQPPLCITLKGPPIVALHESRRITQFDCAKLSECLTRVRAASLAPK